MPGREWLEKHYARTREKPKRRKFNYIGAPAVFALELACQHIQAAFGHFGAYIVGSCLDRADWRDIDVRYILPDDEFERLFPDAGENWELDSRWLLLTVAILRWLKDQTGLPVDFQFQPQTHANALHHGRRSAIGRRFAIRRKAEG